MLFLLSFLFLGSSEQIRKKASVIDLGSGDGSFTNDILQKFLPQDFDRLIGIDICENMVKHSNQNYGNDRLRFYVMDFEDDLPGHFIGRFDNVFSFFALHWAIDQEKAFRNVFDLLSEGGECLMLFLASTPVSEGWRIMSYSPKWGSLRGPVEGIISMRYQDAKDPKHEINIIMEKVGFKNIHIDLSEAYYVYDNYEQFRSFGKSLNPFRVSGELLEEFGDEFASTMLQRELVSRVEGNDAAITVSIVRAIVYGTK